MNRRTFRPGLPGVLAATSALVVPGVALIGCLDRPIDTVDPRTTSTITEIIPNSSVDKIDLVLGIDNSASMADKQRILAQAVPDLVESLVNPPCVDDLGAPIASELQPKGPIETCPLGSRREFDPVLDIHIGIVTSSLGGHGGAHCPDLQTDPVCDAMVSKNDHGHLVARADACAPESLAPTYQDKGFLAWDPGQKLSPPGEGNLGTLDGAESGLIPALAEMVGGAGQNGCGYESQLESLYRFLVDPEPYAQIDASSGNVKTSGVDEVLLAQRKDFLRPDSLVAILMLTDENDCSIRESGYFFRASDSARMPRPRSECAADPNDPCCSSCGLPTPAGCPEDPTCFDASGKYLTLSSDEDPVDLRCFDQKRRFGIDFLYPTQRYVDAFSKALVAKRDGSLVENPLLPKVRPEENILSVRTNDMIFLAGIVGVPWQDIARDPSDLGKGFKTASEMRSDETWSLILGDPAQNVPPLDPLMRESTDARSGVHPITGEPTDTTPSSPLGNSINGHEYDTGGDDLQYACIFDLPEEARLDCALGENCGECAIGDGQNPLCDTSVPTARVRAKSYPGLRHLAVLKGLEDQGIVASVCPKQVEDRSSADYGYRPAIGALVERLKGKLRGPCLPRTLDRDENEQVKCLLVEARVTGNKCSCDKEHARLDVDETQQNALNFALGAYEPYDWDCFCAIPQLQGDALAVCQNDVSDAPVGADGKPVSGYCYVDATTDPPVGNPALVARCAENDRRMIRLVGEGEPAVGATLFVTCSGEF